jgi:phosphoribosylformylglycinamidine synthase
MLWEVDIHPGAGQSDLAAQTVAQDAADLGLSDHLAVRAARGYLIEADLTEEQVEMLAEQLLADPVVEQTVCAPVGDQRLERPPGGAGELVYVLPKPGVTDPVAESAQAAIADFDLQTRAIRTFRKYWIEGLDADGLAHLANKLLANDAIEQVVYGPLDFDRLQLGSPYDFSPATVPLREMEDAELEKLSREGQLFLTLPEMQTIQAHFRTLDRDPTDVELETVAQTWSEHCSHKTLAGRIAYRGPDGRRRFENMLKETIFEATVKIREKWGEDDWCVSVFSDNAGVIAFDERDNLCFKVETHNHPSALEPYGGANTGIGGVIRDPMGTGMGAKPVCNTDIFCFAPPDLPPESVPPGVLHPRRIIKGVVAGVRDYGNRMGIPTVNGAVYFDRRYLGNPLVYCGNVGILPRDKSFKQPEPGDYIVAVGGRTGRDGIHGATFSSAELTHESESLSGGAVQIGNAITEKMVLDVLLEARDRGLYNAVTDCGAGGFSSAVGEMGEEIGAEVELESVPLKYEGLSYTEIWISEAQERMVLSVPPEKWESLEQLCRSEGVEATVIGTFRPTGRLVLNYRGHQVADLEMSFLHDGRPPIIREAIYQPAPTEPLSNLPEPLDLGDDLLKILGSLNVASKHWIVRQYDHEVQGGSVIKPLVGVENDGPGDAAVVRPRLDSRRGIVLSCGMNPYYGDFDTYHMAASAIDEAIRNCVAVGADPSRIAILDNFCWGSTDRPETLGSLVRAAVACHDLAVALEVPFISGKDSLNNEFRPEGAEETISIPPSLLISAIGQMLDVSRARTMDLKKPGNLLYLVGLTNDEMGGSHWSLIHRLTGGRVPTVEVERAAMTFRNLHRVVDGGMVQACHDLSEGGLGVAAAEMAFAGGCGALLSLDKVPTGKESLENHVLLFSESNTRFLCEVKPEDVDRFEEALGQVPHAVIGRTTGTPALAVTGRDGKPLLEVSLAELKSAWRKPLDW